MDDGIISEIRSMAPALAIMQPDMRHSTASDLTVRLEDAWARGEVGFGEYSECKTLIGAYVQIGVDRSVNYAYNPDISNREK